MEYNSSIAYLQSNVEITIGIIKTVLIIFSTYYTNFKLINKNIELKFDKIKNVIFIIFTSIISGIIKYKINYLISIICSILLISIIFSKNNILKGILTTIISITINYVISLLSVIVSFIFNFSIGNNNDYVNLVVIIIVHLILLNRFLKIKKFKYGISFLQKNSENEYIDILILNVSATILFSIIILVNANVNFIKGLGAGLIVFAVIMFITIQKSLQLYYKQKLLEQELNKTKEELDSKTKEIENLEAENIEISKKAHTLTHKQKALAYKIDEMMMNVEVSKEVATEAIERLNEIGKELYKEKTVTELTSTGIPQIDNMLKFMQSECSANKIDFELQVKGNIHYMTNNLIPKEDLETLLADHIKNAIIAINHTDNVNKSILVKLGKIDETYGLYIYDSGIEFEKETLRNLGIRPSTTHKDEGGTGMGFMNTFDTLRKCKASLIIEEYNEPSKDNYTKAIMIKFDNKNEFRIKSYREKGIKIPQNMI